MTSQAQKVKTMPKEDPRPVSSPEAHTVLQSEMGKTHIHQEVVAKIAGLAVREVDGVHELVPFGAGQRLSSLAHTISGDEMKDLGVAVEVGEFEAAVDVRIITNYGVSIPKIARSIQDNVAERISMMTGLKVKEVNIEVVDLYFNKPEKGVRAALPSPEPRVK